MNKILFLLYSIFLIISSTSKAEESGFGYVSVISQNGKPSISIKAADGSYSIVLPAERVEEKIDQLEISETLKKRAKEAARLFANNFVNLQTTLEKKVLEDWHAYLREFKGGEQSQLKFDPCDESRAIAYNSLYNQVNFVLNEELNKMIHDRIGLFDSKNDDIVVVALSDAEEKKYQGSVLSIPFHMFSGSLENNSSKKALHYMGKEIVDEAGGKEHLFFTKRSIAEKYGLFISNYFETILLSQGHMDFKISEKHLMETLLNDREDYLQKYINGEYISPIENIVQKKSKEKIGQEDGEFKIPDFKNITFYTKDGVAIRGEFDGGMKPDAESVFDPSSYYGKTNVKTSYDNITVTVVTEFDVEQVKAKAVEAEYEFLDQRNDMSMSFTWQLEPEGSGVIPFFKSEGLNSNFVLNVNFEF